MSAVSSDQGEKRFGPVRRLFDLGMSVYKGYKEDQGVALTAALAYYALFAMGPIVLVTVSIAGFIIGEQAASGELAETLERYLGPELATAINSALTSELGAENSTTFTIVGAGFLVYGAARLFLRLQEGANLMWGVRATTKTGRRKLILSRLYLLVATLVPALLLIASFLLSSVISWLSGPLDAPVNLLMQVGERVAPALVTFVALLVVFAVLPDVRLSWRDVWLGSLLTSLALLIGTNVFGIYLTWQGSTSFYGAAGAIVALLIWTHYMALIVVIGMRFCRELYERRGNSVRPSSYAYRVEKVVLAGHGGATEDLDVEELD
jgi:membrane protein